MQPVKQPLTEAQQLQQDFELRNMLLKTKRTTGDLFGCVHKHITQPFGNFIPTNTAGTLVVDFYTTPQLVFQQLHNVNIKLFQRALHEQLTAFSEEQVMAIITDKITQLNNTGVDLTGMNVRYNLNGQMITHQINSLEELQACYIKLYQQQLAVMREVSARLDIIAQLKVSPDNQEQQAWEDYHWPEFAVQIDDPLQYLLTQDNPLFRQLNYPLMLELASPEQKKALTREKLEHHLQSHSSSKESTYAHHNEKIGRTTGYIAQKDGSLFMIKRAYKKARVLHINGSIIDRKKTRGFFHTDDVNNDTIGLINEFVAGPLYKAALYNHAPEVELVENDIDRQNRVCMRSKFLHNFVTLEQFKASIKNKAELKNQLGKVQGVEKVYAAAMLLGDQDTNRGNIGIITDHDGNKVLAKIDHGLALSNYFHDEKATLEFLNTALNGKYPPGLEGDFAINVNLFKAAVDDMLNKFPPEELEKIIGRRIDLLKKSGMELGGLTFHHWYNEKEALIMPAEPELRHNQKGEEVKIIKQRGLADQEKPLYNILEERYLLDLNNQITIMQKISARLEIIAKIKISNDPVKQQQWLNGDWLAAIKGTDPLAWLLKHKDKNIRQLNDDLIRELENSNKPEHKF